MDLCVYTSVSVKSHVNICEYGESGNAVSFAGRRSVRCPVAVRNVFGQLHSLETLGGQQHAVRLLEYVPGELLKDVPRSDALCYQLGEFVANLDNKLQVSPRYKCTLYLNDYIRGGSCLLRSQCSAATQSRCAACIAIITN